MFEEVMEGMEGWWQSWVQAGSPAMGEQGFCTSELSYRQTPAGRTFAQPLTLGLSTQPHNAGYGGVICSTHQNATLYLPHVDAAGVHETASCSC